MPSIALGINVSMNRRFEKSTCCQASNIVPRENKTTMVHFSVYEFNGSPHDTTVVCRYCSSVVHTDCDPGGMQTQRVETHGLHLRGFRH